MKFRNIAKRERSALELELDTNATFFGDLP